MRRSNVQQMVPHTAVDGNCVYHAGLRFGEKNCSELAWFLLHVSGARDISIHTKMALEWGDLKASIMGHAGACRTQLAFQFGMSKEEYTRWLLTSAMPKEFGPT